MKRSGEMRVVGRLRDDFLTQMGHNQRRAYLLAPRAGFPKGVQKFRTWDEVASWEKQFLEQHRAGDSDKPVG